MLIQHFRGTQVHGYLNFDVPFRSDLTFLIGLNGSGKTTVVRLIHALLEPNFLTLAYTTFDEIAVRIQTENGAEFEVWAKNGNEDGLTIGSSVTPSPLAIPAFQPPPNETRYKINELATEYYREQEIKNAANPVLEFLDQLPTPMFLGLERRASIERTATASTWRRSAHRYQRSVFSGTLAESLDDASELAANRIRQTQERHTTLTQQLRKDVILRIFEFPDASSRGAEFPTSQERSRIRARRQDIKNTLIALGLSETEIQAQVDPFFDRLDQQIKSLPGRGTFEDVFKDKHATTAEKEAAVNWIFNRWQFDKVIGIINLVDKYLASSKDFYKEIDNYIEIVNSFLKESGKRIALNIFGLQVEIAGQQPRPLIALSSGEQQIVVLLTHLAFNQAARKANVLIIDEPELSLHVSWQEVFADALLRSNPTLQIILATHSPSIILDRVEHCVDLSDSATP